MEYEWQMYIPSWGILMKDHANCAEVVYNGASNAHNLTLRLYRPNLSSSDSTVILYCNECNKKICSVRNGD